MRTLVVCILLFCSFELFAQDSFFFEVDAGGSAPMHKDLKDVFELGLDLHAAFGFNVFRNKLYAVAGGGMKWYFKEVETVNSVTEHLRTMKAGIEFRYLCFGKENLRGGPFINVHYNWVTNYYSSSAYNPLTNQSAGSTSDDFLSGKDISVAIGGIVQLEEVYFKINYEFFTPSMNVSQTIIDAAYADGIIVPPVQSFNLSSLTLSIGYKLAFKK